MDIDRFIATHQASWDRLAALSRLAGRDVRRLHAGELDELVRLYQRASTHLSYAQTYYRDQPLINRLSGLVASAAAVLHGTRPRTLRAVSWFLAVTFPAAVWSRRRFMLVSAVLFFLPALVVAVWFANSPVVLEAAYPPEVRDAYLVQFEEYYASEAASQFSSFVFTNNIRVAALAFAAGVLASVGTAYILIVNGASLGAVLGLFAAIGQQPRFWGLILPHGLLELTCIVVAGGAGMALGWSMISPGDRSRPSALADEGRRAVPIVVGLIIALAVAGTIEGFVTGQPWPTWLRVGIGAVAWILFLAWIVVGGRRAVAHGYTGRLGEEEATHFRPGPEQARRPAGVQAAGLTRS